MQKMTEVAKLSGQMLKLNTTIVDLLQTIGNQEAILNNRITDQ